jgi:hypothetical protein
VGLPDLTNSAVLAFRLLHQPTSISTLWPSFGLLRAAASSSKRAQLRLALGALVSEARLLFGSCFLVATGGPAHPSSSPSDLGASLHFWIRVLLSRGTEALRAVWHWSPDQCALLHAQLANVVSLTPWSPDPIDQLPFSAAALDSARPARPLSAGLLIFLHSLRVGAPWRTALDLLATPLEGLFSPDGRLFAVITAFDHRASPLTVARISDSDDPVTLSLFMSGASLVAVACSHSLLPRPAPAPTTGLVVSPRGPSFPTRFMPDYVRLRKTPQRDVMSVYRASREWHRRLGPLDSVTASIVEGRMTMSKSRLPLRPSRRQNHASWERNEAAKIALGPKFATWTWQGIVEIVPRNCPLPLFIEPLGAVPKATDPFWRLILDARLSNEYQDSWGVWYFSVWQLAALLDHCDIMFAEDLEDAYHLCIFSGCTGRPFWSLMLTVDEHGHLVQRWRLTMGCDPFNCLGFCDKAMSGFCIDGFVGRFAAAHFGQRNAGSPLNALMRCIQRALARRAPPPVRPNSRRQPAPCPFLGPASGLPAASPTGLRRGLNPEALHSVVWVDDTVFVTKTPPHAACPGLAGACPICARSARSASRSQSFWHRLAHSLGLGLSDDKRQTPSQRVTYTGIVVDTFRHTLSIPPDKRQKLSSFLEEFFSCRSSTAQQVASLRGRVQHYSICLPYVLPFVALFSSILGSEADPDYDRAVDIPPAVNEAAVFIHGVLQEFAFTGRRLWPFVASSLYAAFMAGETGDSRVAVLTWDASVHGWGLVLRWWANRAGKVIVGTLPPSADMLHQVRRETLSGVLSLEAAALEVDLSGAVVILRNDAIGALTALRKGSFASVFLQQCAMRACRLERRIGCETLHLHAPGTTLIEEGVDDLSRDAAAAAAGPVSGPRVRAAIDTLARALGWSVTIDAFASASNALVPRFFAQFAEPQAEVEDAFSANDWGCSLCPVCGHTHRETLFAFPPPSLLNRFVMKAQADGARALVVVPLSVAAPWWSKLLRASVHTNTAGYVRLRHQQDAPRDSDVASDLALFPVDFAPQQSRLRQPDSPPCAGAALFRGRPPTGSPTDSADRARIHDALSDLASHLRRPTSPAGP